MTAQPGQSFSIRRLLRPLGNTFIWIGVGLILLISIYLSIVSVATATAMRVLGTTDSGLYGHPILLALTAAAMGSLVVSSLLRVPLRVAHAGAWISHLGLIVLAVGSIWYARRKVEGMATAIWTPAGWTETKDIHVEDTFALYVALADADVAAETVVPVDLAHRRKMQALNVSLRGAGEGVDARVVAYHPHVELHDEVVRNDAPRPAPAILLRGMASRQDRWLALLRSGGHRAHHRGEGYLLYYQPVKSPEQVDRLRAVARDPAAGGRGLTGVLITGRRVPYACEVVAATGVVWTGQLDDRQMLLVPLDPGVGQRHLGLRLQGSFTHARIHNRAEPCAHQHAGGPAIAGASVVIHAGGTPQTVTVPFDEYDFQFDPVLVKLSDGRVLRLKFTRLRIPLPATVRTLEAEYKVHPGTHIPKDYRCELEVGSSGGRRTRLNLNNPVTVGAYQLSQGSWAPRDRQDQPSHIFYGVGSRPGLWLIWIGCTLICAGFPYAFYVKPLLLRRRRRSA